MDCFSAAVVHEDRYLRRKAAVFLCLALAIVAGCDFTRRGAWGNSGGNFQLNQGSNTVLWCTSTGGAQSDIQYVLMLPQTDGIGSGGKIQGGISYLQDTFKMVSNGHQWSVESSEKVNSRIRLLRFSDLTTGSVVEADLARSRFWRLSDEGVLTPLEEMDGALADRVVNASQLATKNMRPLGNRF